MNLGKTLKLLRVAGNISQGKLASELDVTPGYLSLVESGKRQPSLSFLEAAAERFRIPAGLLMLYGTAVGGLAPKQRKLVQQIQHDLIEYVIAGKFGAPPSPSPRTLRNTGRQCR
jgi:transcriptional regulator with XRE-family HTH domain